MKKLISIILAVLVLAGAVTVGFTVFATEDEGGLQPTEETVYTPEAVTGLEAEDVTTTSLNLKWEQSLYATKYLVYRSSEYNNGTMGEYRKVASLQGIENTSFTESSLKAGRIYKYKVYAYRVKNGVTTSSDPASLVVMTTPASTSSLSVKSTAVNSIILKWSKVTPATDYLFYRAEQKKDGSYSGYTFVKKISPATLVFKNTGLQSGKFYKYKMIVRRSQSGITKKSEPKAIKVMTTVGTPTNFRTTKATATSITLGWGSVPRATKYELYKKTTGSNSYKKVITTKKTTVRDKYVSAGANYTYRVRAFRKAGNKTYYGSYATVSASTAVKAVSGVKTKSMLGRALITWNGISGSNGYDVFMLTNGDYKYKASTTYPRYLSGKLKAGKVYSFAIKAYRTVSGQKVYGTSKYVQVKIVGTAYGKKPSGTWVEVCTTTQTLYMYVNNKLYLSTPVVTGNAYGGLATTPGYHHVLSKSANTQLVGSSGGSTWNTFVNYWLGFTYDGQGIHDAPWRSEYGGDIYKGNGSHGCVNTPYEKAGKVFSKAFVGMPVIIF